MKKLDEPKETRKFKCYTLHSEGDTRLTQGGTRVFLFPPARVHIIPNCPLRVRLRYYNSKQKQLKDTTVLVQQRGGRTFMVGKGDAASLVLDIEPDLHSQALVGLGYGVKKHLGALGALGASVDSFDVYKVALKYPDTGSPTGMKGLGQAFFQQGRGGTPTIDTSKQGQTNIGPPVKSGDVQKYRDETYYVVWYVRKSDGAKDWLYNTDKESVIKTARGAWSRGVVKEYLTNSEVSDSDKLKIASASSITSIDKSGTHLVSETGGWKSDELCKPEVKNPPALKLPAIKWDTPDLSMLSKIPEFKDLFPNTSKLFVKNKDGSVGYYKQIKIFERTQKVLTTGMPKVTMSINDFYKIIGNVKLKYPVGAKKGQDFYPFQYDGSNMPVPNYNDFKNMFDGLAYRIVENAAYSTKLLAAISTQFTNGQFVIADLKSADSQTPKQLYTGGGWANFAWDFTWDEIAHSGKGYGGPSSKNAIDSVLNATKSIKSTYIDKMAEGWSLGKYWEDIKRIKEISNAISVISSKTVSQFGNSLRDSMVGLKVIGNGATDVLTQTTTDIGELIKFVAELSTTVVTQVSAEISKKIKEILDNLTKFLTDLMTALNQDTADLRDAIVGMVSEMWTAMSQDIMNIYKSLSETMGTASLNLAKSLESNASKIGPAMETMMADYSDWAKTSLTTVNDCMKHNMNVLTNQFASSIENAEALLNENINKVKAEITKTFDTFKADMTKLTDSLKADVETAKKNVESLKASVDASIQQLDTKTATLKADLDSKYNELSKTFESRQKEVLGQLTTIQDEVKKNADSVKKIYADITSIQSRLSDLEGKAKSAKPSWAFW